MLKNVEWERKGVVEESGVENTLLLLLSCSLCARVSFGGLAVGLLYWWLVVVLCDVTVDDDAGGSSWSALL